MFWNAVDVVIFDNHHGNQLQWQSFFHVILTRIIFWCIPKSFRGCVILEIYSCAITNYFFSLFRLPKSNQFSKVNSVQEACAKCFAVHMIHKNLFCQISNFKIWTARHLAQASCTELTLMPCPFTGRKIFCASPNFLSQPKNLSAFSASDKHFVPDKKMNCIQ